MQYTRAKRAKILFSIVKYANLWGFCCRRRRLSSLKIDCRNAKSHFQMTFSLPSPSCLLKLPNENPGGSEETSNNGRVKWAYKQKSDFPCKGLLKVLCISLRLCTVNRVVAMAIKFKVLQAVTWQLLHRRGLLLIWPFS